MGKYAELDLWLGTGFLRAMSIFGRMSWPACNYAPSLYRCRAADSTGAEHTRRSSAMRLGVEYAGILRRAMSAPPAAPRLITYFRTSGVCGTDPIALTLEGRSSIQIRLLRTASAGGRSASFSPYGNYRCLNGLPPPPDFRVADNHGAHLCTPIYLRL